MALLAHAQEMDTTYVVDEQGRTIGLIHEKGTIPRIVPAAPAPAPVATPAPTVQASPVTPVYGVDSAAYYQDLVNRYTLSGMMIGGSVGVLLGVLLMIDAEESTDRCGNNDYGCNDEEFLEFFTGYGAAIAGGIVFGVGVGLKIAGAAKLRRAVRYKESLDRYNARRIQTLNFRVEPLINPYSGSYGSKISLSF